MYLPKDSSRARQREAENARKNRQEIVQALSQDVISRRDLFRWGLLTAGGALVLKHGLSQWAPSAYGAVPTGTPRSPTFNAKKFDQPLPRAMLQPEFPLTKQTAYNNAAAFPWASERPAQRMSYHEYYNQPGGSTYANPVTHAGPCEGRPPGEFFAHQRWDELYPKSGYILSLGQVRGGQKFHRLMPEQEANAVWSFGARTPGALG